MTFDGSGHGNGLVRAGVFFWDDSFLDLNSSRRARSGVKLANARTAWGLRRPGGPS